MRHRRLLTVFVVMAGVNLVPPAAAQAPPPFFNRMGSVFLAPEPQVVLSGAAMVVTPTVSADRRYVTLGMHAQLSQVVRIDNFPVTQFTQSGIVGNIQPAAATSGSAQNINASSPVVIRPGQGGAALNRVGITLLARLK